MGQNIDVKTDLMNMLEEDAINAVDVPFEIIQARQSIDYALQLTMSNSKFLRTIYKRQAKYERFLSDIITKLYNGEYGEDKRLEVKLPPPMFLNITNTNQVISNTKEYVNSIWEMYTANETDELYKSVFQQELLKYHLGSYIDLEKTEEIAERARLVASQKKELTSEE